MSIGIDNIKSFCTFELYLKHSEMNTSSNLYTANGYNYLTVKNDTVSVTVVTGKTSYVNVTVKNAMQKAWKGLGKQYKTIADALEKYKKEDIKAVIKEAALLAGI